MKTMISLLLIGFFNTTCLAEPTNHISIASIAKEKNIDFGFAVDYNSLKNNDDYKNIVKQQATIIVPTNELKWTSIHPSENFYDFKKSDYIINFAIKNNLKVRGHTLIWHNRIPDYILSQNNPIIVENEIKKHISTVVGQYKNKIQSWDVVNEVINPSDDKPNGLRDSYWYKTLGERYIDIAFQEAHKADPNAILVYNEWGVEYDTKWSEIRRNDVIKLIKRLKENNIPISGFGIQSHLSTNNYMFINDKLSNFITNIQNLGLNVYITELDVLNNSNISESEILVSNVYKKYIDIILKNKINTIVVWGVTDNINKNSYVLYKRNYLPNVNKKIIYDVIKDKK